MQSASRHFRQLMLVFLCLVTLCATAGMPIQALSRQVHLRHDGPTVLSATPDHQDEQPIHSGSLPSFMEMEEDEDETHHRPLALEGPTFLEFATRIHRSTHTCLPPADSHRGAHYLRFQTLRL